MPDKLKNFFRFVFNLMAIFTALFTLKAAYGYAFAPDHKLQLLLVLVGGAVNTLYLIYRDVVREGC